MSETKRPTNDHAEESEVTIEACGDDAQPTKKPRLKGKRLTTGVRGGGSYVGLSTWSCNSNAC